ncbi:hypothetical protein [Anabaena azotica]|uniref:Uncharacterized protein n=1 Tax=Anabaena azotica FACHB-119 TaxID=947527 RepID=A0ABR8CYY2_9NOST|nr:hypothetical protein [Anabaena azotica]MBD2500130.1 hypothetical protein [Anabaena azotica FACHB-119]
MTFHIPIQQRPHFSLATPLLAWQGSTCALAKNLTLNHRRLSVVNFIPIDHVETLHATSLQYLSEIKSEITPKQL